MIGHYEIFPFIILQCNTAKEKLQHSKWEKTNKTVEEEYMVNTFDLGVRMNAFHLVWKHPYQYSKHIIFPFTPRHDSTEILMEAELVTSGTLLSIPSRKAYWKSLFLLKAVGEALERLLFETLPNKP